MQIEIGRYYINKTWKYLRPCLKDYGEMFVVKYSRVYKLAVGIHDTLLDGHPIERERAIFILLDRKWNQRAFDNFIRWIRHQEYHLLDYPFDDMLKGRQHMVVLRIPDTYDHAYDQFIKGRYSKMYVKEEIARFYDDRYTNEREIKDILLRRPNAKKAFMEKIRNTFGTIVTDTDMLEIEYDFPPEKRKEIFNYRG